MKKSFIKIAGICLISMFAVVSCKSDSGTDDPAPTTPTTPTNPNEPAGIIKVFPYAVMPNFSPVAGTFSSSDPGSAHYATDSADGSAAYPSPAVGKTLTVVYTVGNGYMGAGMLKNYSWTATSYISSSVKKITMKVRSPYNCNITFLPFGTDSYGKVELYQKSNTAALNPVYEDVVINLSGAPTAAFASALSFGVDFGAGPNSPLGKPAVGTKVVFDIKDIKFE